MAKKTTQLPPPLISVCSVAKVLYPFTAVYDDELSVCFNDIVSITGENVGVEGWCVVSCRGETGKLPSSILEVVLNPFITIDITMDRSFKPPDRSGQFIAFEKGDVVQLVARYSDGWDAGIFNDHLGLYPSVMSNIPAFGRSSEAFTQLEEVKRQEFRSVPVC